MLLAAREIENRKEKKRKTKSAIENCRKIFFFLKSFFRLKKQGRKVKGKQQE